MFTEMTRLKTESSILVSKIVDLTIIIQDEKRMIVGQSYIQMLRNAVVNNDSKRQSGSGSKKRVIISVDALDLLMFLQHAWGNPLEFAIVKYHREMQTSNATLDQWYAFVGSLNAIIESIDNLLNPSPKWHLDVYCPVCNIRMAKRWNMMQELVQVPAIEVDVVRGARCLNCAAVWPVGELEHLADTLGCIPIDLLSSPVSG